MPHFSRALSHQSIVMGFTDSIRRMLCPSQKVTSSRRQKYFELGSWSPESWILIPDLAQRKERKGPDWFMDRGRKYLTVAVPTRWQYTKSYDNFFHHLWQPTSTSKNYHQTGRGTLAKSPDLLPSLFLHALLQQQIDNDRHCNRILRYYRSGFCRYSEVFRRYRHFLDFWASWQ